MRVCWPAAWAVCEEAAACCRELALGGGAAGPAGHGLTGSECEGAAAVVVLGRLFSVLAGEGPLLIKPVVGWACLSRASCCVEWGPATRAGQGVGFLGMTTLGPACEDELAEDVAPAPCCLSSSLRCVIVLAGFCLSSLMLRKAICVLSSASL